MKQLTRYYVEESKRVHHHRPYVTNKQDASLGKFEVKLVKQDIDPRRYAEFIIQDTQRWVQSQKGWKTLPVHIFTGKWALGHYIEKVGVRVFEEIDADSEDFQILVQEEFMVMQYHKFHSTETYDEAIEEMEPFLSDEWKSIQDDGNGRKVYKEALKLFKEVYGV